VRRLGENELERSPRSLEPVARVEDRSISGPGGKLGLRVYWPKEGRRGGSRKMLPLLVYIHGGGFVAGSVEDMDGACRRLANRAGFIVLSVRYRLAPEDRFPAAAEDCYAALRWAHENAGSLGGDASRLVVAGSSAGGNLAAVACLIARERGGPKIARQVLVYPVTDVTRSLRKFAKSGFGPTDFEMKWFYRHYLNRPEDATNPLVSPLLADLHGLPPATLVTAQYDTLTEQAEDYADKLEEAGVRVRRREFEGMIHGFFGLVGSLDSSGQAIDWVAADLKALE
jgi:acetyl esterase